MAIKQKSYYKYKYLNNGYWKEGGQPRKGLIAVHGLHLNILIYNRKLYSQELKKYNLELIEII